MTWYRDGLSFACQRCGNCCSGKGSIVIVSPREREAIARHLGMPVGEFEARHTKAGFDDVVLIDDETSGDCEWLERRDDGTTACRVQEAKPDQCRSYPFWPNVVASRESWDQEARRCRGIGQGDPIPATEVERRSGIDEACGDMDVLLEELDHEVADLGARCWLSGDCCDFDAAGHRLFVSQFEAQRFAKGVDLSGWDPASRLCPAWKDRRCTAREHRPLSCRTYFCDPAFAERVHELTERYVTRLKWLHEKHGLVWDYRDFIEHLARIRASVSEATVSEATVAEVAVAEVFVDDVFVDEVVVDGVFVDEVVVDGVVVDEVTVAGVATTGNDRYQPEGSKLPEPGLGARGT